jgi:hypothetical protein
MLGELLAAACGDPAVLAHLGGPLGEAARAAASELSAQPDRKRRATRAAWAAIGRMAVPAGIRGVHPTFPLFVRSAYGWLIVAAALGAAAALWDSSGGIWGASRHAITVGFVSVMVFCIGQRVLPAFAAMGPLWSPRLMFAGLLLLSIGCALRVVSEVAAYQSGAAWAWNVLPASALLELIAVTLFAVNMTATYATAPEPLPSPVAA